MANETADELFRQGNALFRDKDLPGAAACYRRALLIEPAFAAASFNLGCTLDALSGPTEALPHFADAARLRPEWCEAHSNLGFALARVGRMAEAASEFEAAASLRPDDAGIRNNLGLALSALGRGEEAYESFREAIRLDPLYTEAHNNLAVLFERFGRSTEAIASCLEALKLRPEYPEAHNNLANALKSQGRHAEAVAHFREALRLKPDFVEAQSSLLFSLLYAADISEEEVAAQHVAFGAAHRFPAAAHDNAPSPDRILHIGYVSADFRSHAVARFIEPVLRHHDRSRFRIFCYSNVSVPDSKSAAIAGLADRFVNIAGVSDEAAEKMIRRDRIDILVDLCGHTAENRLLLFARKPAPIQVSWLGYPHTTGLAAIDYRITDAVTDPPGATERFYAEKLLRLPGTFSCFAPPAEAPEVTDLPLLSQGVVTFGSFNNPAKITPETVALWASVLESVPGSRMLVKGYSLADAGTRERLSHLFAEHGIPPERLLLVGNTPSYREHLALYGKVDIALDTFPYHGTTTTCEALWMGVPVVTLCGAAHRSRVGASLLATVGLDYLAATDTREYRDAAIALAGDAGELARLRKSLRGKMAASPLTDGAGFTRKLESAFREVWRRWCGEVTSLTEGKSPLSPLCQGGDATLPVPQGGDLTLYPPQGGDLTPPQEGDLAPYPPQGGDVTPPPLQGEGRGGDGVEAHRENLVDPETTARLFLLEGKLDEALRHFLIAVRVKGTDSGALGGIEETLNLQMAADLAEAVKRDAGELAAPPPTGVAGIQDATLEDTAELLLAAGFVTPADLICRYLLDRGHRSRSVSRTLGEIALSIGQPAFAAAHFSDAIALGDDSMAAKIKLLKAEESARLKPVPAKRERFLLIKAWGYGFWSDVNHVLGQLLVAEMTGRTPVVHWGGNSLFSDAPDENAFESFFEPVSPFTLDDLRMGSRSFYPPKWNAGNLAVPRLNQADGPWSRISSLHTLEREEDVAVSDYHYAVNDLIPWILPGHRLHGLSTDEVYLYLFQRYLKVKPCICAKADAFFMERMAGKTHLALHVRGGDKGGEDANLATLNMLYQPEIERYLGEAPQGRLFLMTDDREILSGYLARYGDKVVTTSATRTSSSQGVHYQSHPSRSQLAEEVIVDVLLALRCERFIGNGLSNVSCAVAQMKQWAPGSLRLLGARLDRLRQVTLYRS